MADGGSKDDVPGGNASDPAAASRIIDLYRRHGTAWAADRGTRLVERAWLDRFLAMVPAGAEVLDLGCGSGQPIARYLLDQGRRVTGIDTAAPLLALARAMAPACTWIEADMRGLALGRRFGGILAWDSFFHLGHDDQRRMFAVFARHAAGGAPLMVTSGPAHGVAIGRLYGEPLYHASLDAAEYRQLLSAHGFVPLAHVAEDPSCAGHTIWLAQYGKHP
ncbi:class I SAM-dependent methyltransferase [Rhodopila sp.]|uniref:class I SAM-dependent methyltransferase n=1 Tax=Rhodopila sp. TaxID=2480087 RepID=UPI002BF41AE6|nr:class I SAM-dependent methyltransferase [Rhodopila sp.]HVZ10797.1 class I SAM-dependent methyltransferase [Rhodopila sp.]